MSTMPTRKTVHNAEATNVPEPQTAPSATKPAWHRPVLTRIDIKATLSGGSAASDGTGLSTTN